MGGPTASLATARLVALYLLSTLTVSSADLAWGPPRPARIAADALLPGLALVLGRLFTEALSAVGSAGVRRRVRAFALVLVPLPSLLASIVPWSAPALGVEAASSLAVLQVAVLLLAEALALEPLALWCAFVLLVAALALLPSSSPVAGPHGARGPFVTTAPDVHRAYLWLVLLALAGTGTLIAIFRWLRGRGHDAPPLVELAESHVEAEEVLEPPTLADPPYAPARGRVIRAYLRFLGRARESGLHLEPCLTPREIESRVRRPEEPLDLLTALFMDARYGPDEPGPETVREAEAASRAVCSGLLHRRRADRRAARRATVR
jgi:hypothetical protein